jgi:hypothetical protein
MFTVKNLHVTVIKLSKANIEFKFLIHLHIKKKRGL